MSSLADGYGSYADLTSAHAEGTDYRAHVRPFTGSSIAVIAPHGGGIEQFTSDIARAFAGTDINFYPFEGIRQAGNYTALHLTSHKFDEPSCLALLSACDHVVAIHGCGGKGTARPDGRP